MIFKNSTYTVFTAFLLFFSIIDSNGLLAQTPHPILRYFGGDVINNEIRLRWAVTAGNTCSGIRIQRSADGYFFHTIGEIDGICGSSDAEIPYVFVDAEPLNNQTNYYRLELGTQGFSTILQIAYVPLNEEGYSLRYDITSKTVIIDFSNSNNDIVRYNLISLSGAIVLDAHTNGTKITLHLSGYSTQIFLLRISSATRIFAIKILAF